MFRRIVLRFWYRLLKKGPNHFPMVHYWKSKDAVEAKLTTKQGARILVMDGEKHPIYGFPRGHLLIPANEKYGSLSILKHQFKDQIFNKSWEKLEQGVSKEDIIRDAWEALDKCLTHLEPMKYDLMPPESMCPAVREIHRAWTKVAPSERSLRVRDALTLILQEDDAYRYRVQWMCLWLPWFGNPIKILDKCLRMVELGEIIGDMKRKIKLLRRVMGVLLEDPKLKDYFVRFFKEVDWKKVRITQVERYHFRAKYFKCDMDVLTY